MKDDLKKLLNIFKNFNKLKTFKDQIMYIVVFKEYFSLILDNDTTLVRPSDKVLKGCNEEEIDSICDSIESHLYECIGQAEGIPSLLSCFGINADYC